MDVALTLGGIMKKITILGVTGSIGTQSVDVALAHPELFEVVAVSAGHQINRLKEILEKLPVQHVCVVEKSDYDLLRDLYPSIQFHYGDMGLIEIATLEEVDIVLNAIVGFAGLCPTIKAIESKKDIALANKETLVVAGHLICPLVEKYGVKLLPVDSEHSAIFQCLQASDKKDFSRILLTASGGSFRDLSREALASVTVEQALKHPNWSMGAKITIDSATLFNKGLEVIEAKWLFNCDFEDIQVLIHPESIIHSMVEFCDGAIIAQLGVPDMRLPIQYALTYPSRFPVLHSKSLKLDEIGTLHFSKPDFERFRALKIAYEVGKAGGSYPAVMNGANEQAVALFLNHQIQFLDIETYVIEALKAHDWIEAPSLEQLMDIDTWARTFVKKKVG